nr:unnamed protein product [Callosobruchus analis]
MLYPTTALAGTTRSRSCFTLLGKSGTLEAVMKANGRTANVMVWVWKLEADGSTGANGRKGSKADME